MKADSWKGSLLWGRLGGSVLVLIAFTLQSIGLEFDADAQQAVYDSITGIFAAIGVILPVVSKIREQMRKGE